MRFTPIAAWAVLAYGSVADDAQKVLSDESSSSAAESATSSVDTSLPTFTVSSAPKIPASTDKGSSAGLRAWTWSSPHIPLGKKQMHVQSGQSGQSAANFLVIFQPTTLKAPFLEQFTDDWEARWKPSHAKKDLTGTGKEAEEWAYVGEWSVEEPTVYKGMEGDKGLVVKNKAAHHAISAKFPEKIDNKGKTLVVQYEAKLQSTYSDPCVQCPVLSY